MISWIISLDTAVEQALFAARTPLGVMVFSWFTELGGGAAVALVMIVAFIAFWKGRRWPYALGLIISLAGSFTVTYILKHLIARARPPIELHAIVEAGYSFPSNHATAAMALYGFLAFTACRLVPRYRALQITLFSLVILAVGFSRMYLGVHYLSDVLAGFIIGGIFAWLGSIVTKKLEWIG